MPSAQTAATVESFSVLIALTLALQYPAGTSDGSHFLDALDLGLGPSSRRRCWTPYSDTRRGDHQWAGGNLVHDRLRLVRHRHNQDRGVAALVRHPGGVVAPAHFAGFRDTQPVSTSTAALPIAILGSVVFTPAGPGPAIGCGTDHHIGPAPVSR